MLSIDGRPTRLCDGITRREALRVGGLHLAGLTLPMLLRAQAQAKSAPAAGPLFGRAKNVIWLYLRGGASQFETFDPKPDAPVEVRGIFQPISTNVPGIQICELLPRTARMADKLAIVRSMSTDDNNHESGGYWVNTGHKYNGPNMRAVSPTDWPCLGSLVKMLGPKSKAPFRSVMLPERIIANPNVVMPGQNGGFMGQSWDPDLFICDPTGQRLRIDALVPPDDLTPLRLSGRRDLLSQINQLAHLADRTAIEGHDLFTTQALDILFSGTARKAFAIERESSKTRDRYGRAKWGQTVLLARRLVEAGVRMVFVNWPREPGDNDSTSPLWDTHAQNNPRMRDVLCPQFDLGFSALIEDLEQRGLLAETLVVAIGEMGRTPKFNPAGGRDHWGYVFSFAMAGAGISGAQVWGASDAKGMYPAWGRVQPQDLTATVLHLLGIDHETVFHDRNGRPQRATEGTPMFGVLGTQRATKERTTPGGVVGPIGLPPTDLLVNRDFDNPPRLEPIDKPIRGWLAAPLAADAFGARIESIGRMTPRNCVSLGFPNSSSDSRKGGPLGPVVLGQEFFAPVPGKFTVSAYCAGTAESEIFYRDLLLNHFACRLVIFGFQDNSKSLHRIREFASVPLEPPYCRRDEPSFQKYSISAVLKDQEDNLRQLVFGAGVAMILEPTAAHGPGSVPAGGASILVDKIEIEFSLT